MTNELQQLLPIMFRQQHELNKRIHPEWWKQDWPFRHAIDQELSELRDHIGWKWWKQQKPDMEQVELELVDIWHFGLSLILEHPLAHVGDGPELDEAITDMCNQLSSYWEHDVESSDAIWSDFIDAIKVDALSQNSFNVTAFRQLLDHFGMSFKTLYAKFVGKNILNEFRQANGYKEGTYLKVWDKGLEDNEVLTKIMKETFNPETIASRLMEEYSKVRQAKAIARKFS